MNRGNEPAKEMTIRERFAMAAMQGLLANPEIELSYESYAKCADKQADALLAEREKRDE